MLCATSQYASDLSRFISFTVKNCYKYANGEVHLGKRKSRVRITF